jgi:hypothetical protein
MLDQIGGPGPYNLCKKMMCQMMMIMRVISKSARGRRRRWRRLSQTAIET